VVENRGAGLATILFLKVWIFPFIISSGVDTLYSLPQRAWIFPLSSTHRVDTLLSLPQGVDIPLSSTTAGPVVDTIPSLQR